MRTPESEAQLKAWMLDGLDGDSTAHAALLRALVPLLKSFYRRRLHGTEEDVQDLVQETLISVHTRRASYDRDRPFTAWLYAVARYRMIDHFRRQKVSVPIEDVDDILIAEGFEEAVSARMDVDTLLDTLSPKQARAIRDTHIEGKSIVEAAVRANPATGRRSICRLGCGCLGRGHLLSALPGSIRDVRAHVVHPWNCGRGRRGCIARSPSHALVEMCNHPLKPHVSRDAVSAKLTS